MRRVVPYLDYLWTLLRTNLRAATRQRVMFASFAVMMFVQNLIMFMIWLIFFANFSSIGGWQVDDIAVLFGAGAFGYGFIFFFFGGTLSIARLVADGALDPYLGRPKGPLLALMMSDSRPTGLGDMATAIMLWLTWGGYEIGDLPILLLIGVAVGVIFLAIALLLQSWVFFAGSMRRLAEQLMEIFIMLSLYPQVGFAPLFKLLMFTIIPAWFVAFLPVEIMRGLDWPGLAGLAAAAAGYLGLAVLVFQSGLRRYRSANNFVLLR